MDVKEMAKAVEKGVMRADLKVLGILTVLSVVFTVITSMLLYGIGKKEMDKIKKEETVE